MYVTRNYATKKALRLDVQRRNELRAQPPIGDAAAEQELARLTTRLSVYQPNGDITGAAAPRHGRVALEGPHYPQPHRWYASATLEDGVVVKVS